MPLTIHHTRNRHGDPLCLVRDLPGLDAEMTPADLLALARQLTYAAHDAQAGMTGEHRYPEEQPCDKTTP